MKPAATACLFVALIQAADGQTAQGGGEILVFRTGAQAAAAAPAQRFTGTVHIDSFFQAPAPARTTFARVAFQPGARTAWHAHALGQTLVVTAGRGLVQAWGAAAVEIRAGDLVWIPPGVKHWHGAARDSAMTHAAVQERSEDGGVEWMEPVSDAQYEQAHQTAPAAPAAASRQRPSQAAFGEFAPKLAELTDSVLYGDVWARPQLSRRDRSLATVAALIAMNRPDQLRSHLRIALQNGLTREELIEAITHLAFYAGWPSAVTAIGVAREVLGEK
ncbi:MAG: carboxymuconolactone decarboxylase family protein [Bryobacteraceae bacterium]